MQVEGNAELEPKKVSLKGSECTQEELMPIVFKAMMQDREHEGREEREKL